MAGEQRTIRLGDVCDKIGSGATPRGGGDVYIPQGISLIRSQNIYNYEFHRDGLAYITEDHAKELSNVEILPKDVLLNITGDSVARCCMVAEDVLPARVNQHVAIIRPVHSKLNPQYLMYSLVNPSMQQYLLALAGAGATINALTKGMIEDLEIPFHPIPIQGRIAEILGSLDRKIELNRKTNETLEAMARTLFKSWFIDFDPVRAKFEGRDTGLPKEIADLFPDEFQGSELGEIPKGWCVVPLIQAIEVNPFRPLHKGDVAPYLDMANMPTTTARANGIIERVFGSGMRFIQGDTLVARITPCLENGKTCFVDFLDENKIGWGSTEYIVFRSKPPLPLEFSYFLARTDNFRSFAISNMTGTSGRQRVPADCFNQYLMVLPSTKVTETFGQISSSVMRQMKINDKQSQTLVSNRDLLLLKLISGEIDIRNFENESKVIFK